MPKSTRDISKEPEQEPVALLAMMERAFWRMYQHGKDNNPASAQCEVQALHLLFDGVFKTVAAWDSTTPPQRTWVGLTDDEIEMIVENKRAAHWEFVRQVEAKLKEKNT